MGLYGVDGCLPGGGFQGKVGDHGGPQSPRAVISIPRPLANLAQLEMERVYVKHMVLGLFWIEGCYSDRRQALPGP